jgi:hypothetical protein
MTCGDVLVGTRCTGGLLAVGWLVASPLRESPAPHTVDTVAA